MLSLADLSGLFWGIVGNWWIAATGVGGLVLTFYSLWEGRTSWKGVTRILGFGCLLLALIWAWRDEHRALGDERNSKRAMESELRTQQSTNANLRAQLQDARRNQTTPPQPIKLERESPMPKAAAVLQGQIDLVSLHRAVDGSPVNVAVVVNVRNSGAPSVAENYALSVTLPSGQRLTRIRQIFIPDTLRHGSMRLCGKDALEDRTTSRPIPTGGAARGILLFELSGVRSEDLQEDGTKYEVTFADSDRKPYRAELEWSSKRISPILRYPGMSDPFSDKPCS